ncbi:HD domain-containing protein [Ferroacidibacillus organovorans]|uniref:HD/PDEase domain-containing protein n=1 Tax=Ferroacidibacillus organovorans TaxID=1765683 RepID=A0A162TYS9_9BACL|nr:HD domain-containing protein [Ferroacidibacillus organovorans]KYP81254.1 hypothetical protein AYJ22_08015 [Ferroacidibacillus organovorans]OAG93762.1 hypothetical protein AYW79_08950 [Ferroacidibacillus organovorans]OPG16829.1 hypothetical protein B2M26_04280 [Ferroacidibacillus organovorans]
MKSFRDPVHNLIAFGEDDQLLIDLINTAEVQRLRRIRQLGLSNIVYPGAEHSRFVHSLGVAHLTRRFLDEDRAGEQTRGAYALREYRHLALAAALLHDIGHGPFSHALEAVTGIRHERFTSAMIRSKKTEVHQVLEAYASGFAEQVARLIEKDFPESRAIVKLLSSQLDMDRTDYLLRDALMTGAGYGTFDVEWLLHVMRIGEVQGEPEIGLDLARGQSIAEDYIMCRYYMYLHVYFHRLTRSAEVQVERTLARAAEVGADLPGFPAMRALLRGDLRMAEVNGVSAATAEWSVISDYLELDDHLLWSALRAFTRHEDPVLADLSQRLLNRHLFHSVDVHSMEEAERWLARMGRIAKKKGLPAASYVIFDQAGSQAYKDSYLGSDEHDPTFEQIYLFDASGNATELARQSFIVEAVKSRRASVSRVLFPREWLDEG